MNCRDPCAQPCLTGAVARMPSIVRRENIPLAGIDLSHINSTVKGL